LSDRATSHRIAVPPVALAPGESRPLWSVMIPTYNCAGYLRQSLGSVLAQDPGPEIMQIEVVDDASSADDPAAVVAELGNGRVGFFRQPENVGHIRNFETCLLRSRGRLVHLLHGDDWVREGFYRRMAEPFLADPALGAAFCRHVIVDDLGNWMTVSPLERPGSGILANWLETIAAGQRLQTPSMVVRREVYERLGGFDRRIFHYVEDWEMWVRIAAHYPVWYEAEPLAFYRVHANSISGRGQSRRIAENGRGLRRVVEINREVLPAAWAGKLSREALRNFASSCLRRSRRALAAGDRAVAFAHLREAWRTHRSFRVLAWSLILFALWLWRPGRARGPHA
jgi:glycosyltransferase involved in cell wall biosynthesis